MRLECQPPQCEFPAVQLAVEVLDNFIREYLALFLVDLVYRIEDLEIILILFSDFPQGHDIFRETAAAIADAGEQESAADTFIGPDAAAHSINVNAYNFAQVSDFV